MVMESVDEANTPRIRDRRIVRLSRIRLVPGWIAHQPIVRKVIANAAFHHAVVQLCNTAMRRDLAESLVEYVAHQQVVRPVGRMTVLS